ncbi:flagellar motor protein MotB [Dyella sp. LX-66]|uniref:flagellar motor protein MotB n=1 Tax=unclassified Dyella TaxID=2634549 RepID=UPI001BE0736E|nr:MULTISPECIES: flagellar motor protein MotB [unclassified Dyella]MBT2117407.1 flagellar motor protein MotB [Dyella sp. LX-1]MBT2138471.1 flagellar motor protein MotB [Dyella sp. LX-66]
MSEQGQLPPIVVRRVKRRGHGGHHGGAWKVAYADFVTAMMAFFLVMWLIGAGTREQRAAISEYFKNPSMTQGTATMAPPGQTGPGGASTSMIKLGGAKDLARAPGGKAQGGAAASIDPKEIEREARRQERARLEDLMQQLQAAIQNSQALAPFKDQLLLDITPEGLRIQIVDKQNRPMFDMGSAQLRPYTTTILEELAGFIDRVPNRISLSGHTDDAPYNSDHRYSNWELSADRANAARRALLAGGLTEDKIARVVGLAASVPFDRSNPADPVNRRISIIVMNKQAEASSLSQEAGPAVAATAGATLPDVAPIVPAPTVAIAIPHVQPAR